MARKYATVDPALWDQTEFRRLPEDGRLLFFYLTTCRHCDVCAYLIAIPTMAEELQWQPERIHKAFKALSVKPFALYDAVARVCYIPGWWSDGRNKLPNSNMAKFVATSLYRLPSSPLKARAVDDLKETGYWSETVNAILGEWVYVPQADDDRPDPRQGSLLGDAPPAPEPPAAKTKRVARESTRIDRDWQPTDEMRAYACEKGFIGQAVIPEVVKFVRYYTSPDCPTPGRKDWLRSWQNWIDKAAERKGSNGTNGSHAPVVDNFGVAPAPVIDWAGRMKHFRGPKRIWLPSWGPMPGEKYCEVPPEFLVPST